jgi:predicted phage terminase large subunit-like protein
MYEAKPNAPPIMEVLQLKIPGIIPITPVEDKVTRMTSITTFLEAGNVLVPSLDTSAALIKHSWLPDALEELAKFPNVTHDDFSDSFSIGLRRIYVEPPIKRKPMRVF